MSPETRVIGYSLSKCVRDIADGTVPFECIEKIIAGTKANTPRLVDELIWDYGREAWDLTPDPERCYQVARDLFAQGKVDQPLLRGEPHPGSKDVYWVDAKTKEPLHIEGVDFSARSRAVERVRGYYDAGVTLGIF